MINPAKPECGTARRMPATLRPALDCRVPIALYHSVSDDGPSELALYRVSCAAFREQMQRLVERGYYSVSLDDWARCIAARRPLPGRPVIITFDGGYRDFSANAWPVLADTGLRATVFVDPGHVGRVNDRDDDPGRRLRLMDWNELRAMQRLGNTIGSHGAARRELTKLSDEEIARDCGEARAALRAELGREATAVAFPWGLTNLRVRHVLAENGYRIGVGTAGGLSALSDDVMDLPRIEIFGDDNLDAFALKLDLDQHEGARPAVGPAPLHHAPAVGPALPRDNRQAVRPGRAAPDLKVPSGPRRDAMSFVLPIALSDTGRPGSELARLRILLASFVKYFDMSALASFIVVTRPDDLVPVGDVVGAFPIPSLALVNEQDLCPELAQSPDTTSPWPTTNQGWHRQQLLKLACHERVPTDFYMTLDADVLFVRPFTASSLFRDGKSLVNTQRVQDYERIWLPEIVQREIICRIERARDAARILRMDRRSSRFYGETPVVLSTRIVGKLVEYLATTSGINWRQYLLEQLPWTEYSLYFSFADAVGLFDRYHVAGGFNAILGMCDSLWSAPECYTDRRSLSSWEIGRQWTDTIAVVVQSYLGYSAEAVGERAAVLSIL